MNKYIIYFSLRRLDYYFAGSSGEIKGDRASATKEIEKASTYNSINEAKLDLYNHINNTGRINLEDWMNEYGVIIETIAEHMIRKIIE